MEKRKTKRQKHNQKIAITVILILAVLLGIVSIVFVAYPEAYPFRGEGGLSGLFGVNDYGTEIGMELLESPEYNQRPLVRIMSGPHSGDVGVEYEFSVTAYDPDGDALMHRFFWGDGTSTGWLAEERAKHKYNAEGTYQIMVQVFDGRLYGGSGRHQFVVGVAVGGGIELTVPLIEASNVQSGTYARVTIRVQTEAEPNDFDVKAYVKSPSGVYLVNIWSLSKTKNDELYTATLTYKCDEEGIVTIGAQTVSKVDAYRSSVVTEKAVYSTVGGIAEGTPPQPTPSGGELQEYEAPEIPGFETIIFIIAVFVTCIILYKKRKR